MKKSTNTILTVALLASSMSVFAQANAPTTSTTMPSKTATQPTTAVGVSPQTAAEANSKAVPRTDTATVVRTSPNAANMTRNATDMPKKSDDTTTRKTMRPARADRN